jgi:hypothetical protein
VHSGGFLVAEEAVKTEEPKRERESRERDLRLGVQEGDEGAETEGHEVCHPLHRGGDDQADPEAGLELREVEM